MDISNWETLKHDLGENTGKPLSQLLNIPYSYPPKPVFLSLSDPCDIPPKYWPAINDPTYDNMMKKQQLVDSYFGAVLYVAYTAPSNIQTFPAGQSQTTTIKISQVSVLKQTNVCSVDVRSLIKGEASGLLKGVTLGLTTELETKFGYIYSTETTDTKEKTITKTVTIPASDKDRILVPWNLSKILVVYRKHKTKGISLICADETIEQSVEKFYNL